MSQPKRDAEQDTSDRELVGTRVFDAPRALVFQAWSDPEHLKNWWGPHGFATETLSMDFRPGGIWRLCMHGPDRDYHNRVTYLEIVEPERIVFQHGDGPGVEPSTHITIATFEDLGGKTRLTMRLVFASPETKEFLVKTYKADVGLGQTLDRLGEYTATLGSARPPIKVLELTRTFDAPRSVVFKAWIERDQLARWWGPHGFTNPVCAVDARPGGGIRIDMKGPDGSVYPMTGVFREVDEPARLVFTSWGHMNEKDEPAFEIVNTVTFAEEGGKTTLTLRAEVVWAKPDAAPALSGMEIGWGESLDRLAAEVAPA